MVTIEEFRQWALAFPETAEMDHFGMPSFRVKGKIFATYHQKDNRAMLKLSLIDQSVYSEMDNKVFYPVPGGWGRKGSTFVELKNVKKPVFREALKKAWSGIAPAKIKRD